MDWPLFLEFLKVLAPIIVSVVVGVIAWLQWKLAKRKVSLDLYDRRYEVFAALLDFYNAVVTWDGTPEHEAAKKRFFLATKQAHFLFSPRSGIAALLDKMFDDGFKVIACKQHPELYQGDPAGANKLWDENFKIMTVGFSEAHAKLREKLDLYLRVDDL